MNANLKYQMKNKVYLFHSDPGHAWLAVKERELIALGLQDKISGYSYVHGKTVYLEEDCDAALFFNAYQAVFDKRPVYRESWLARSPVRYYEPYPAHKYMADE